jgi:hypothetical protein
MRASPTKNKKIHLADRLGNLSILILLPRLVLGSEARRRAKPFCKMTIDRGYYLRPIMIRSAASK